MSRKPNDVTDAELAILQILWDRQVATVRELTAKLYPAESPSDLATVQKLLKRLEEKHCVLRDRSHWPHLFRPAIERAVLIGRRLQDMADDLCAGALTPLLTHLVQAHRLSARELASLRSMLDELETAPGAAQIDSDKPA
jgi:predicted transcriptional regulator